jgi:uncharacterized protein YndB with AHSA1/START domain
MRNRNFLVANHAQSRHDNCNQEAAIMTNQIERSIELRVPVERVWQAITDHRQFGEWFRVKIDAPFMPGKASTGHITHPGYEHVKWKATVKDMDEPRLFSFTWHPYAIDQDKDYSHETPTLVEFRLTPTGDGTRLTVVESGFDQVPADRRAEAFRMNDNGWAQQMKNIRDYVER